MYRRLHEGEDESSDAWATGRLCIMPNLFAPLHFEWRVPIDDHRTLGVVWVFERVPAEREPYEQEVIPHWWGDTHDPSGALADEPRAQPGHPQLDRPGRRHRPHP